MFPLAAEAAAKIQRAGGLVGVGGHGQLQGLGYHWEMWGLDGRHDPEGSAQGRDDRRREDHWLRPGPRLARVKLADLVVLDKNPLLDIRNTNSVRYVMKNGNSTRGIP